MGMFEKLFSKNEKPRYSFELVNDSLIRENRKQLIDLIVACKTASDTEKIQKNQILVAYVTSLFEDLHLVASEANLADFIRTFAEKYHDTIAAAVVVTKQESVAVTESVATVPDHSESVPGQVPQPRRVTNDILAGIEPVAKPIRTPKQRGEDTMARLQAEARANDAKRTRSEQSIIVEDEPRHRASEDSLHGAGDYNLEWSPEAPKEPKVPRQTL
jgi:hypothetical protein